MFSGSAGFVSPAFTSSEYYLFAGVGYNIGRVTAELASNLIYWSFKNIRSIAGPLLREGPTLDYAFYQENCI